MSHWIRPAFVLGIWLLGLLSGQCFWSPDGHGDDPAVKNAVDSRAARQGRYGPFGEVIQATGRMAKTNPFRFSTKYQDDESDLLYYGYRYHNASTGRWLSRDPLEEDGGLNLYDFANNNPPNATDALGLVIETACDPIDDYLNSLGISFQRTGNYHYTFEGTDLGTGMASPKMIVTRMLFADTVFTVSSTDGSAADNLKKHIHARLTIVRNALRARFRFGAVQIDWTGFAKDPQAFFDRINNGNTTIACHPLTKIIFETGNLNGPSGVRYRYSPANRIWIPGDWGYIRNTSWSPSIDGTFKGENVIHVGHSPERGEMFWGHDQNWHDQDWHPMWSEFEWFDRIRHWRVPGTPEWRNSLQYPLIGLERPTTPPQQ